MRPHRDRNKLSFPKSLKNRFYPDFILGDVSPIDATGEKGKSILIGDIIITGNSLYNQYVKEGRRNKLGQFEAITRYAAKHTYTHTAVFLTAFTGNRSKLKQVSRLLARDGLTEGVAVFVISAQKNKKYRN
jgi:hypothetical protein